MRPIVAVLACLLAAPSLAAQPTYPTQWNAAIAERPDIRAALARLEAEFPRQVEEWIRIAEMPGKSEHEQQRGAYVRDAMQREGLAVTVDSIGNVIGRRRGSGGGATVVFAAHIDIVHPLETNLKVSRAGDTLKSPGIFDNSASVANMLAVVRALNAAKVQTKGDLIFIATTQEELGLRGMDYWFEHNPRPDILVAMDGGLGPISYGALGIYWTKYHYRGEGSHTNTSTGKPHPARAVAEAIRSIYEVRIPEGRGGAVYNVGQVHGGSIFNGIPQEVWFSVDLRSVNPQLLDSLDAEIVRRAQEAATRERVEFEREVVQRNRAGGTEEMLRDRRAHPLVQTAIDIHRFVGIDLPRGREAVASGSTDSNMGVVRGIPSISVGRSVGGNQHTLSEWAHAPSALPATKMVLLLAVAMGDGPPGASRIVP